MNLVDLLKKNIVMVPVVASLVVGTFTGVRYIVNLTDSINTSEQQIINLERDLKQAQKNINEKNTRLWTAESTCQKAENKKRQGVMRNEDGFWESWGRAVASPKEFARYGIRPDEIDTMFQIDQVPFEGEDLGFWGNAVEILMQEALTMGP